MLHSNGKGSRGGHECVKQETNQPDLRSVGKTERKVSRAQATRRRGSNDPA